MESTTALMNPVTGEQVLVADVESDIDVIQGFSTYPPTVVEPSYHEHPHQEERLGVVSGTLLVRIEGKLHFAGPGDQLMIPAGAAHQIANSGGEPAHVVWQFEPALRTGDFLRASLASSEGTPRGRWQRMVERIAVATEYSDEYRKATLPWIVQRPALAVLSRIAARPVRRKWKQTRKSGNGITPTFVRDRLGCTG
jgi:mannose-6-phosphate isomerase-like protein (cupin superfamily)